ncbi:MAG: hypothetical protein KAJ13_07295 [Gemmatimonadetes bacterium]|nr:hypothetical protein [Gemmatimonadota bacterium]
MIKKMRLPVLSFTLMLALSPVAAVAQESTLDAEKPEPPPASQPATNLPTGADAGSVLKALQPSSAYAALLLAPPAASQPTGADAGSVLKALQSEDEDAPTVAVMQSKGSSKGLGFMIGGGAALVGGLLIGGTGGNLIAAGGVALGVYGIIIYF